MVNRSSSMADSVTVVVAALVVALLAAQEVQAQSGPTDALASFLPEASLKNTQPSPECCGNLEAFLDVDVDVCLCVLKSLLAKLSVDLDLALLQKCNPNYPSTITCKYGK